MRVEELVAKLEDGVILGDSPAVVMGEDGTTYTITEVVEEHHELGSTVWLKVQEN